MRYLDDLEFSDLRAFNVILNSIPNNAQLQLGNSSIVRYAQLFNLNSSLSVFCNRGTSGIDGSTSTAIGASLHHEETNSFLLLAISVSSMTVMHCGTTISGMIFELFLLIILEGVFFALFLAH